MAVLGAGCGSSSKPASSGSTSTTNASRATSSSSGASKPTVDLTFSGTAAVTAKGSAGTCQLGKRVPGGGTVFGFLTSGQDYAGLGDSIYFQEDVGSGKLDTKWVIGSGPWFGPLTSGYSFSSDHHTLTIDTDMPLNPGRPEHVKGTIHCP